MNITTLIVLAWLFGAIKLTKVQLIEALDEDTEDDLTDFDFGQLMLIADLDKFAVKAKKMALAMLRGEVYDAINILSPKDPETAGHLCLVCGKRTINYHDHEVK